MFRIIIPPSSLWSDSISNNAIGLFLCKWYALYCFLLLLKSFRDYLSGPVAKTPPLKSADMVQSLVRKIISAAGQWCAVTGEASMVQPLSPPALEPPSHKRGPCAAAKAQSSQKNKKILLLIFGILEYEYNVSIGVCGFLSFFFFLIYSYFCGMMFFNSLGKSFLSLNSTSLPIFAFCPFGND